MKNKSVLLVGCGDIGLQLGRLLQGQNFDVTGLRRSVVVDAGFPIVQADLLGPESLSVLSDQYDFIVYTATPSAITPEGYEAIYFTGLKNLMAATKAPTQRLLLVSSTAVYHQSQGERVDEQSDTHPVRFSGQVLLKSERLAHDTWKNTSAVRFGGIYGPGRLRLVKKVQQGCSVVEAPPQYTNRIHRDDCVGLLNFLIGQQCVGRNLDPVYLGVDDDAATNAEVLDFIAMSLQLPLPKRESADNSTPLNQNKRCQNTRIKSMGFQLKYPSFREGYLDILAQAGFI